MEKKTIVIGQMDNTQDHTFESANRVYGNKACCPTIPTCGGGGIVPKVVKKMNHKIKRIGGVESILMPQKVSNAVP